MEACCSIESLPLPPPPADSAAAAAAAKLLVGVGAAGGAPNTALRLSSAPRFSLRERGVSAAAGPAAADAMPVLEAACVAGGRPDGAVRLARGVTSGSRPVWHAGGSPAPRLAAAAAAGVPNRVRTLSSSPADLDMALCCSEQRSTTLRSYFSHCEVRGGSKAAPGAVRRRRRAPAGTGGQQRAPVQHPQSLPTCDDSSSNRLTADCSAIRTVFV